MMKKILPLAVLLGAAAPPPPGVSLTVTINNVTAVGHVRMGVCREDEFLQPRCSFHARVPAQAGSVTITIPGIPPGVYAVQAHQDLNDDDKVNRNLFGIPTEPIGFSNDPKLHFAPPHFSDSAIRLGPQGGAISLTLHQY